MFFNNCILLLTIHFQVGFLKNLYSQGSRGHTNLGYSHDLLNLNLPLNNQSYAFHLQLPRKPIFYFLCWIASDNRVWWKRFCNYSPNTDYRSVTNLYPGKNLNAKSNPNVTFLDQNGNRDFVTFLGDTISLNINGVGCNHHVNNVFNLNFQVDR